MTTTDLRREAKRVLDRLPPRKVRAAAQVLAYLDSSASDEATEELLAIPGLLEGVREAEKEIAAGKGVDWRKVRRDV